MNNVYFDILPIRKFWESVSITVSFICRKLKFVTNLEDVMQHKHYNTKLTFLTLLIFDTQLTKINAKIRKYHNENQGGYVSLSLAKFWFRFKNYKLCKQRRVR